MSQNFSHYSSVYVCKSYSMTKKYAVNHLFIELFSLIQNGALVSI